MYRDEIQAISNFTIPFKCPLSCCSCEVTSSSLLTHLIQVHHVKVQEVIENEKITVVTNPAVFERGESVCIGILALKTTKIVDQRNALLPCEFKIFDRHIPILIMAARENYEKILNGVIEIANPKADFVTFWLSASISKTTNFHATITIHDEFMKKSSSSLVKLRGFEKSQNIVEFCDIETDYLRANLEYVKQIKSTTKPDVDLEGVHVEFSIIEDLK